MKFEIIFSNEFVQSHSPLLMIHFLFYLLSFGIINRRVAKLNGRKQRRRKYAASERVVAVRVKLTVRGKKSSELVVVSLIFASRCHFSSRLLCRTVSSGLANASRTVSLSPCLHDSHRPFPPVHPFSISRLCCSESSSFASFASSFASFDCDEREREREMHRLSFFCDPWKGRKWNAE